MTLQYVKYGGLWGRPFFTRLRWGSELMVTDVEEGDLLSFRASCPVSFLVHAHYGSQVSVEAWAGIDATWIQERAVYGKLYHKGLKADSLGVELRIANITDDALELEVSSRAASAWGQSPRQQKDPGCPKCGHEGVFVRTALTCPTHGWFAGF